MALKLTKSKISIFIIWLFAISGIFGILSDYQDWFLHNTPLNLYIYFLLIVINLEEFTIQSIPAFLIPFLLGFISEGLGVNMGYIFGSYAYGDNLGFKIWGVPLTICFNWILLTVVTQDLAKKLFKNRFLYCLVGAMMMVVLDIIIEVTAPRFDYWEFENGIVPLQNYLGWLFIGFLAQLGYSSFQVKTNSTVSLHLLIAITIFFSTFLLF